MRNIFLTDVFKFSRNIYTYIIYKYMLVIKNHFLKSKITLTCPQNEPNLIIL